ncbi:class I SAM-dependent methyltransferase [Alicyclobacillus cycloheptanicus]|jgi:ubiquinone/menaquinone biosynthesis C-methylase UbiE|uniref:Ubiquinone/menaquinone biosynthesis C-methylase UbiE n=1 Tax=Alicyclobacillus cycloheptanicus TaxID=1457 RepID=A0ABT9XEF9_9BACL|nr:class I SAM-dependent methyltransferase [Alicyclobacillus cycloheptanicus]MDQ0188464.1 ubiquinone/menaquinone biosynthesis C-methylase UbiE [Alicyclobacillus cycloheptanicus]WDM01156.1 class I SAM-dependent methyltransferase [Alicyclobacillus cycloheptanicus]
MDYQDVLAEVGAGSAHPGGMASTELWLQHVSLSPSDCVLEIGCGTGRTLVEVQRRFGCQVTGVDIRPAMIRKAKQRAKLLSIPAKFLVGNAESLRFPSGVFDVVITESVNVFCDPEKSISEVYRVLKPGGHYVDVEMLVTEPVTEAWRETVAEAYGVRQVPDLGGWRTSYRKAGFEDIRVLAMRRVIPDEAMIAEQKYPDPVDLSSKGAYRNPLVLSILEMNAKWLDRNHHALGYGIFLCTKG